MSKNANIENLRDYDKKEYLTACKVVEDFFEEYGKPETWTKEQVKAMKFQYANTVKVLAEEGKIMANVWLNLANFDSHIKSCTH